MLKRFALHIVLSCQKRYQYKYAMRFLPHREHSVSITQTSRLMVDYRETAWVCAENNANDNK